MAATTRENPLPAFLRDVRVLQIIGQIVFAIILVALVSRITTDVLNQLAARNLTPNIAFLQNRAGFDITEAPDWYNNDLSYGVAFQVGLTNTLRIVVVGLFTSTLVGIFGGIFLLSRNWLIRTITRTIVEVVRNTPLLLQLFVWYFIVLFSLPQDFRAALSFPPEGVVHIPFRLAIYAIAVFLLWRRVRKMDEGSFGRNVLISAAAAIIFVIEAAFWLGWTDTYANGSITHTPFIIYLVVSVLFITGATFVPTQWRALAVGSAVGQLIGGLLFYFGIIPNNAIRQEIYPAAYASIRGFGFPEINPTARFGEWAAFAVLGIALAAGQWIYFGRLTEITGQPFPRLRNAVLLIVGLVVIGWVLVGLEPAPENVTVLQDDTLVTVPLDEARANGLLTPLDEQLYATAPLVFRLPEKSNFRFTAGTEISLEYMALLIGLTIYTGAFIAEIVRAGIQAVPYGQVEAARAVGLTQGQVLRLVILPQALRVIIPPLGNQYLNLSKNSSLAIAVAYSDLVLVTTTIMNQSGQSVTGMAMILITYLIVSLTIATVMSAVNRRFQLVTR
jgi:general L-amino acid transport system permease protein